MKVVAYRSPGPIGREDALQDITLDKPQATSRDLLVKVHAVSVNPVDAKVRVRKTSEAGTWGILSFDTAGVVEAVGPEVKAVKAGDAVFYAGSITRPGTNSEYHLIDKRIVGRKPATLSHAEAAALPLTGDHSLGDAARPARRQAPDGAGRPSHPRDWRRRWRRLDRDPVAARADRHDRRSPLPRATRTQVWVRECGAIT